MFRGRNEAAVIHRLEAVADAAGIGLAKLEPGRLVSASVRFPDEIMPSDQALAGDSRWYASYDEARGGGIRLIGAGTAAGFDGAAGEPFEIACADWRDLGPDAETPMAFFTVPSATAPAFFTGPSATAPVGPRIWVPEILVGRRGAAAWVTLSLWWGGGNPEAAVTRWRAAIRALFCRSAPVEPAAEGGRVSLRLLEMVSEPDDKTWARRVSLAAAAVADGWLDKVVLARRLSARLSMPADAAAIVDALARFNPDCQVFSLPYGCGGRGRVIAASPELLAVKRGRRLVSHALAGTARRPGGVADQTAAAALLASTKDRREHAVVVEAIVAGLAQVCETVEAPPAPTVMPLRFLQHLWTPITGQLRPGVSLHEVVARLHPTPAVLGHPAAAANAWLRSIGERRDGLYTGVAGWVNRDGDGDAAVVLRSAYLEDGAVVLWAGAGIVAGSDPDAEWLETEMKLASMLEVLNGA